MKAVLVKVLVPVGLILAYVALWLGGQKIHQLPEQREDAPPLCVALVSDKPLHYRLETNDLKEVQCRKEQQSAHRIEFIAKSLRHAIRQDTVLNAKVDVSDAPEIRPMPGFNYFSAVVDNSDLARSLQIGDFLHGCVQIQNSIQPSVPVSSRCSVEPLEVVAVLFVVGGNTNLTLRFPSEKMSELADIVSSPQRVWQLAGRESTP